MPAIIASHRFHSTGTVI